MIEIQFVHDTVTCKIIFTRRYNYIETCFKFLRINFHHLSRYSSGWKEKHFRSFTSKKEEYKLEEDKWSERHSIREEKWEFTICDITSQPRYENILSRKRNGDLFVCQERIRSTLNRTYSTIPRLFHTRVCGLNSHAKLRIADFSLYIAAVKVAR